MVELMIVVAIIGVLSSLAIPTFKQYKTKVYISEVTQNLSTMYKGQVRLWDEGGMYTAGGAGQIEGEVAPHCVASCVGPLASGGGWDIPTGGEVIATTFGDYAGCKQLGFESSAPVRAFYLSYSLYWGLGAGPPCGSFIGAGGVYANYVFYDFDGDGTLTQMLHLTMVNDDQQLYRGGYTFTGDPDDI